MAVEITSGTQVKDFQGLIDAVDDSLTFSEKLVNIQLVVKQEATVRPGLKHVVFEAD